MATLQDVFDRAEVLSRELKLQSAEADVTKGIVAANIAKDYWESIVAQNPNLLGDDIGTVTTSASTESTAFPTGLLRLDSLWYIDPSTSRPGWELEPIHRTGGHADVAFPPILSPSSSSTGRPKGYWTDGSNIYWEPLPSGTHTVRYYGFAVASAFTAAANTFPYPDIVLTPFAAFLAKAFKVGLEDQVGELESFSQQVFGEAIDTLTNFQRDGAQMPTYRYAHST